MSLGAGEELRFYLNLLKNNWLGPKYDLPKIPGPPGYWGAGEPLVTAAGPTGSSFASNAVQLFQQGCYHCSRCS
jgi:hypothetical protein